MASAWGRRDTSSLEMSSLFWVTHIYVLSGMEEETVGRDSDDPLRGWGGDLDVGESPSPKGLPTETRGDIGTDYGANTPVSPRSLHCRSSSIFV